MNTISPKVAAGAGAAGGSTPLSIIIVWLLSLLHLTVPPEVAVSIAAVVAMVCSALAGYLVPHGGVTRADLLEALAQIGIQVPQQPNPNPASNPNPVAANP